MVQARLSAALSLAGRHRVRTANWNGQKDKDKVIFKEEKENSFNNNYFIIITKRLYCSVDCESMISK